MLSPRRWFGAKVGSHAVSRRRVPRSRLLVEMLEDRLAPSNTGVTGGGLPFGNSQPSLGLHYIIATQGIFPSRAGGGSGAGEEPFIAEVRLTAFNFAPGGWAFCDGQLLAISQNTALFSLLGTTYGGDGRTTFALPDLRGRAAVSAGQGPALTERFPGEEFGQESTTLTVSQLPAHQHSQSGGTTGISGGGQPLGNTQPSLGLNYIIAPSGIAGYLPEVRLFAGNFEPNSWLFADGRLPDIDTHEGLFSEIGTTYGGDGVNTFALPDLQGRVAVGAGQGPGLTNRTLSERYGGESVTLGVAQMPSHTHTVPSGGNTGAT